MKTAVSMLVLVSGLGLEQAWAESEKAKGKAAESKEEGKTAESKEAGPQAAGSPDAADKAAKNKEAPEPATEAKEVEAAADKAMESDGEADAASESKEGFASFYRAKGKASGAAQYLAAHPSYPVGTLLKVVNLANDKSVTVEVVGHGPSKRRQKQGVIIDISKEAAKALDFVGKGKTKVRVELIRRGSAESKE